MVVVYPVYLIPDEEGYVVDIPDMKTHTEGKDLAEAIFMARDAIGQMGIYLEELMWIYQNIEEKRIIRW